MKHAIDILDAQVKIELNNLAVSHVSGGFNERERANENLESLLVALGVLKDANFNDKRYSAKAWINISLGNKIREISGK